MAFDGAVDRDGVAAPHLPQIERGVARQRWPRLSSWGAPELCSAAAKVMADGNYLAVGTTVCSRDEMRLGLRELHCRVTQQRWQPEPEHVEGARDGTASNTTAKTNRNRR